MPYASDAQRKKFHAMDAKGEIAHAIVREFDQATKGKKLPTWVKPSTHIAHRLARKTGKA